MKIYGLLIYLINYSLIIVFGLKKLRVGSFVTKALLTPILLMIYLAGNKEPEFPVILALFFCFLGDVLLEYPRFFIPGLLTFLVGHVFYGISFLSDIGVGYPLPWWLFLFAILYVTYGIIFCTKLSISDKKKKLAVSVYCGIILLVSFLSLLRAGSVTEYSFWMVLVGTLLFITSDSILAYNRFQKRTHYGTIWVMATYGAAQLIIILGL